MITYSFPNKVVLVTGSSRGMGAFMLEAFAKAGATCFVQYYADPQGQNLRDAEQVMERAKASGAKVHLVGADVRKFESVQTMFETIKSQAGRLDILVNNAGILRDRTIKKMSLEEWHTVLETNLNGVFYCSKLAAEMLADGGRIINVSSIAGLVGFPGQANYAAAKAGVLGMTRVLAKELAKRGITVNAVAPGVVQTPMLGDIRPEVMAEYEKQIPVGRVGRPEDVANAVLFFASEESGYITGQTLPVTGGWY
ncbi:MAG: 3-oxoacyl-ACP reductase family protein [Gemmataceae bacterium]